MFLDLCTLAEKLKKARKALLLLETESGKAMYKIRKSFQTLTVGMIALLLELLSEVTVTLVFFVTILQITNITRTRWHYS